MGDDPPYLAVGTEVSAKYKGAFCEAKIRKVVRIVKCKVTFKSGLGTTLVSDDQIKGTLRVGANVEAKHTEKNQFVDATINKIQDCSQYTVVFDDGDITTLRRSALCLKSGRHFNESETLDQLPLTHPEHFSNPVVGGRRGVRRRNINTDNDKEDSSDDEDVPAKKGRKKNDREPDMGKVVCVESTDKKKTKDSWFPALVVSPSAQETVRIRTKDDYLVRSFRDGRYYTVPKKETKDFKEVADKLESNSNVLRTAVEKATNYLEKNELPPHWDRDILFGQGNTVNEESNNSDEQQSDSDSSEDDPTEDKDRFVAQLYKFMDDRGTPINKVPLVCNKDLELYKLYKIVKTFGGYNKVTNGSQWKLVTIKMGYGAMPSTSTINLVKQSYKKCVYHYEEFNRKLGCTMNSRAVPTTKSRSSRQFFREKHASGSTKDMKKDEPEETVKKEEEKDKKSVSSGDVETEPPISDSDTKKSEQLEDSRRSRSRQESRSRTKEPEEVPEKQPKTPIKKKRVSLKEKEKECIKEEPSSPAVVPKKGGRGKKKETEEETEKSEPEEVLNHIADNVLVDVGHKLLVYYGPQSEKKVVYEAKVLKTNMKTKSFLVHYTGWNTRYDEWIKRGRISENLTFKPDQGKPAQGRGPAGYAETTESESSSSTKVSTKSPKRKPRAIPSTPTAASGTRSKSGISRRKRFSGESEIIKRRKTRQKSDQVVAIPSVSGSDAESSDSEDKAVPLVSTPPSSVSSASSAHVSKVGNLEKRNEDDDASSSSTSSSSIVKLTKDNGEKDKDKQNQVIDLNQIRSEMKGLDKMVKSSATPTPPSAPTPPLAVSELKLDIYDFQDDTIDAPKLKMFAPRSPDKKEEKSEIVTPVKQVVSPDIVDQGKEREALRQAEAEKEKSVAVAEAKDNTKSEFVPEADKIKEEVSRPLTPKVSDTEAANQGAELQTLTEKPSITVSSPAPKTKASAQSSHILKVATPTKSKGTLSQSPRQRSPVAAVAHPPPPPLVRSSGVIVAAKPMTAPLVQVRPPLLIQRPPASLATGSLVRLAVAGPPEIPARLPAKIETIATSPSTSLMKTEGKGGSFSIKLQEVSYSAQETGNILSTSSTVATGIDTKEATPTKILTTGLNQTVSESVAKPTSFAAKVGSFGKEKKHVVVTQIIDSTVAITSSLASSQASATPASTTAKKKKKEVISKKFVESDSDSSKEAESPKKVIKRRQRSETPKKGAPPAKKKKLDLAEGHKPLTKTTRAVKGRPPNKKGVATTSAKAETEKNRSLPVNITEELSESQVERIEERVPDPGAVSPDIVAERVIERTPVKQEKYFERLEKHSDKEKTSDSVEKEVGSKQSKQMEKKEKDREQSEKEASSKQIKPIENKDQVTENPEKDIVVIPRQNKQILEEDKATAQVEKLESEVEKKCKVPEKKEVEKPMDKKDKTGEKILEKKEKAAEKHIEKKEKNVDRKEKNPEKKEKNTEKNVEKKEKNIEKHVDKKEKSVEKHSDKKEKTGDKILDKKEKPAQKTEKNLEKGEKGTAKKHVEKKDKKVEKPVDKKEKSSETEKRIEKKEKSFEAVKKLEKREKPEEKEKCVEKKESEREKGIEKSDKLIENLERNVEKSKSVDHLDRIGEKMKEKETVQKHEKLVDKPGKHEKQGKKTEKNKSTMEKTSKPEKLSKFFEKQKPSEKLIKTIEIDVPERSSKPSDKQSKDSEKFTKQYEKREKLPEKQAAKKEIKKERDGLSADKNIVGQTSTSVESKISSDNDVAMKKPYEQLPIKEENKNVDLPIKVESNLPELPLMNPCSVDLSGSAKALEKIPILPTISVTIPSKVMSLNLVELTDKKIETPTLFFTSKAVDINSEKTEVSAIPEPSSISPLSAEKEVPMSLVSDEVIAKSPEPENEGEMENLRLKASEKQENPVQDDLPCGLLLCEEIIPGSPAAGDESSRFSFEDDLNEDKTSKSTIKTSNVAQSKPIETPVVEEVTNSRFVDEKPEQEVRTELVEEKRTRPLILEKEESNKSASEEQRNSFNTQQDTPQSIETTPPMTPELSSGSSISSGSPRIDVGSQSPLAARGSSKSKESSDGDEDIPEFPKGNDNDDNYLSNETGGKTSKASNSSIASSTKRTRLSEPRSSRNISPPAKRRRIIRRKSPEEVVRSYPYRGRSSTGRKSQTGLSNDSQDHHKAMAPPPPINLGRPPRSSRFNFIPELDASMDSEQRIDLINQAIQDLREKYVSVKSEMLSFERRRKRWKRREREKAVAERAARQEANRLNS